jgi:hypothetical protein
VGGKVLAGSDWITRRTVYLNREIDCVLWAVAKIEKTSVGAAIEKRLFHPDSAITPSPDFTGLYFPDWPWISILPSKNPQELVRYEAAMDGGTLEYVFEAGELSLPQTVTKEKVAEIAANFMTTFYGISVGTLETQELREKPKPFWLVSFSDTIKPLHQMFFAVVLPDGIVVVPRVERRLVVTPPPL